ncbi:MAG: HAMP domain-containing protein [Spirochaetia bacterium]|nr:HAMP domain-containing protein [Spirochaetia bacterium]
MKHSYLQTKNNIFLFFHKIEEFYGGAGAFNDNYQIIKNEKIKNIYLYSKEAENEIRILDILSRENIPVKCSTVNIERIERGDLVYVHNLNKKIRNNLSEGSTLFLYDLDSKNSCALHIVSIILFLNLKKETNLMKALEYLTGKTQLMDQEQWIIDYHEKLKIFYTKFIENKNKNPENTPSYISDKKIMHSNLKTKDIKKLSRFTIRFKLLAIITFLVISSLSTVIFLASFWFKEDMRRMVQSNNLETAAAIGGKAESEFKRLAMNSRFLVENVNLPAELKESFFMENPEIIFAGILRKNNSEIYFEKEMYNTHFMKINSIEEKRIRDLHKINKNLFIRSFAGVVTVENITPGFSMPLIGIAQPASLDRIMIIYVDAETMMKIFSDDKEKSRIVQTYMVNHSGDIIAHSDINLVLARASFENVAIVSEMKKSRISQGLKIYQDEIGNRWMGSFEKFYFGSFAVISTIAEEKVFENVVRLQYRNLLILIIVVNLALLVAYYFSKTLTKPIIKLVNATRLIDEGRFDIQLDIKSMDEVGLLTGSFMNMARGLAERERVKSAFGKFVNPAIAERALNEELKPGGENKECAVFFSDLRNFTAISEKFSPEEVVEFLNEYFTEMVKCVNQTHGVVDKFIGDAVMAHWGALVSTANDTELAVNSALMMRKSIIKFNKSSGKKRPLIKIGCGINTGPVIAGQIGSSERHEFTVIGDAVNLASRIEALNKPMKTDILISQHARDKIGDIFRLEEMPSAKLKGKSREQKIYAVIGRYDDPEDPKSLDELRTLLGITDLQDTSITFSADGEESKYEILGS